MAFVLIYFYARSFNQRTVDRWIKYNKTVLQREFYQVGTSSNPKEPLVISHSPTSYATYATGRENIASFNVEFGLIGRHNPISLALEYVMGFIFSISGPEDVVKIEITPNAKIVPFIFGIIHKDHMKAARDENYALSLSRTSDSSKLSNSFVFMSESNELTDILFTPELSEAVKKNDKLLRVFAIADQGKERPKKVEDITNAHTKLILTLNFPKTEEEGAASAQLIQAAIDFIDLAVEKSVGTAIRPEIQRKIKATRDAEVKKINKALDQERAEELAQKKAEELREKRDKISKLSPEEQRKAEQKQREKQLRKQKQKQSKRM